MASSFMNPLPLALHRHADQGPRLIHTEHKAIRLLKGLRSSFDRLANFNIKFFSYLVSKTYEGVLEHYHASI